MSDKALMQPLLDELQRQNDLGRIVDLWLRDDDAVVPTSALTRFNVLIRELQIPACLAVIPIDTGKELSTYLSNEPHISVAVHGWSHKNHAPMSEKKQELGTHRSLERVLVELSDGFNRLKKLYPEQFVPLLVPPWNRIAEEFVQSLPQIGFEALSTFGSEKLTPIKMINMHVDLIDWKGTRGGRSTESLVADLVSAIKTTQTPIGFLTHHLVHDESAWRFMEHLFELTAQHTACRWLSIENIVHGLSPNP